MTIGLLYTNRSTAMCPSFIANMQMICNASGGAHMTLNIPIARNKGGDGDLTQVRALRQYSMPYIYTYHESEIYVCM